MKGATFELILTKLSMKNIRKKSNLSMATTQKPSHFLQFLKQTCLIIFQCKDKQRRLTFSLKPIYLTNNYPAYKATVCD